MLKNSNTGYNWLFQTTIGYYNGIFLISIVFWLVWGGFFWSKRLQKNDFFQRVHLYIWALAGHKVVTLSIQAQSFNSYLISQAFY